MTDIRSIIKGAALHSGCDELIAAEIAAKVTIVLDQEGLAIVPKEELERLYRPPTFEPLRAAFNDTPESEIVQDALKRCPIEENANG